MVLAVLTFRWAAVSAKIRVRIHKLVVTYDIVSY
jgi:hypothetical protein